MTNRGAGLQACRAGRPKGLHYICVAGALLCATAIAGAQDGRGRGGAPAAPPAPKNLQVLPKDTPPAQVLAQMQAFTRALGVQCTYCHIEQAPPLLTVEELEAQQAAAAAAAAAAAKLAQEQGARGGQQGQAAAQRGRGRGRGGPQMDYASDDKRTKRTARVMLAMTRDINEKLAASLHKPAGEITRVQCATCHRGVPIPAQLSDVLRQTMLGKGEGAAVVQYRDLRQQYLTSGAYDFRETTLLDLGRESLATHKPDDALAWLQLNAEFYPKSVPTYLELSKAHLAKRDRDSAVSDLTKALSLDPSSAEARRELDRLKKS